MANKDYTNWLNKQIALRRGYPEDKQYLKSKGYTEYGTYIGPFQGGHFGGSGAGGKWTDVFQLDPVPVDYVRNTPIPIVRSFTEAFKDARDKGLNEFVFNNKTYTTEISDNPEYSKKEFEKILLNKREILDNNKKVISDSTRFEPWIGQIPGIHKRKGD